MILIFRGIHEFSKFFMLKRFWSILALKKCWANWPNTAGKRVKSVSCYIDKPAYIYLLLLGKGYLANKTIL
jgi:hypothetical protein